MKDTHISRGIANPVRRDIKMDIPHNFSPRHSGTPARPHDSSQAGSSEHSARHSAAPDVLPSVTISRSGEAKDFISQDLIKRNDKFAILLSVQPQAADLGEIFRSPDDSSVLEAGSQKGADRLPKLQESDSAGDKGNSNFKVRLTHIGKFQGERRTKPHAYDNKPLAYDYEKGLNPLKNVASEFLLLGFSRQSSNQGKCKIALELIDRASRGKLNTVPSASLRKIEDCTSLTREQSMQEIKNIYINPGLTIENLDQRMTDIQLVFGNSFHPDNKEEVISYLQKMPNNAHTKWEQEIRGQYNSADVESTKITLEENLKNKMQTIENSYTIQELNWTQTEKTSSRVTPIERWKREEKFEKLQSDYRQLTKSDFILADSYDALDRLIAFRHLYPFHPESKSQRRLEGMIQALSPYAALHYFSQMGEAKVRPEPVSAEGAADFLLSAKDVNGKSASARQDFADTNSYENFHKLIESHIRAEPYFFIVGRPALGAALSFHGENALVLDENSLTRRAMSAKCEFSETNQDNEWYEDIRKIEKSLPAKTKEKAKPKSRFPTTKAEPKNKEPVHTDPIMPASSSSKDREVRLNESQFEGDTDEFITHAPTKRSPLTEAEKTEKSVSELGEKWSKRVIDKFQGHAHRRMAERDVSEAEVEAVVKYPDREVLDLSKFGYERVLACKTIGGRTLLVPHQVSTFANLQGRPEYEHPHREVRTVYILDPDSNVNEILNHRQARAMREKPTPTGILLEAWYRKYIKTKSTAETAPP